MKKYKICVQSCYSNDSDYKEYDNYIFESDNSESAREYAQKCINNWNQESKDIIYSIFDLWEI